MKADNSIMNDCIFCKIVSKQIESKILFETDDIIVFPDINPAADVHILIVPKKHIANIRQAQFDGNLLSEIYQAALKLVEENNLNDSLYRVVVNGGKAQQVPHLHFHLLGGQWKKQI